MVKKYFSISIAKHGENRVVQDRTKWSKIGGLSEVGNSLLLGIGAHQRHKETGSWPETGTYAIHCLQGPTTRNFPPVSREF